MNRIQALWIVGAVAWGTDFGAASLGAGVQDVVQVGITVTPIAEISFPDGQELYLLVPPPGSTIPDRGVRFVVSGNAMASISAKPDSFLHVASYMVGNFDFGPFYLAKATNSSGAEIGYNLELRFPVPVGGVAALTGNDDEGTSPLTANVAAAGGQLTGIVHMEASHRWTADGTFPLPGMYEGTIVLTVTAGN